MDYRCLYGHRVASGYKYAIENDQCPICGAEMISVDGYKVARRLAESVPLDGSTAFRTVKLLEVTHEITPRTVTSSPKTIKGAAAVVAEDTDHSSAETDGTEILLDEEELAAADGPVVELEDDVATPGPSLEDEYEDAESVELIAAEITDEQDPRQDALARQDADMRSPQEKSFSAEEDAFFASSP